MKYLWLAVFLWLAASAAAASDSSDSEGDTEQAEVDTLSSQIDAIDTRINELRSKIAEAHAQIAAHPALVPAQTAGPIDGFMTQMNTMMQSGTIQPMSSGCGEIRWRLDALERESQANGGILPAAAIELTKKHWNNICWRGKTDYAGEQTWPALQKRNERCRTLSGSEAATKYWQNICGARRHFLATLKRHYHNKMVVMKRTEELAKKKKKYQATEKSIKRHYRHWTAKTALNAAAARQVQRAAVAAATVKLQAKKRLARKTHHDKRRIARMQQHKAARRAQRTLRHKRARIAKGAVVKGRLNVAKAAARRQQAAIRRSIRRANHKVTHKMQHLKHRAAARHRAAKIAKREHHHTKRLQRKIARVQRHKNTGRPPVRRPTTIARPPVSRARTVTAVKAQAASKLLQKRAAIKRAAAKASPHQRRNLLKKAHVLKKEAVAVAGKKMVSKMRSNHTASGHYRKPNQRTPTRSAAPSRSKTTSKSRYSRR